MSTEFNPAYFEHEGVRYEARWAAPLDCAGCAFKERPDDCKQAEPCCRYERPDWNDVVWVRTQEEPK